MGPELVSWLSMNAPLYTCDVCGYSLDPHNSSTLRLAEVWLLGRGKTVKSVQTEKHFYIHEACFGRERREQQESLF